jgi:hypothetical protein
MYVFIAVAVISILIITVLININWKRKPSTEKPPEMFFVKDNIRRISIFANVLTGELGIVHSDIMRQLGALELLIDEHRETTLTDLTAYVLPRLIILCERSLKTDLLLEDLQFASTILQRKIDALQCGVHLDLMAFTDVQTWHNKYRIEVVEHAT